MSTFRALCAELLQPLAEYDGANPYHKHRDLITRARAELAKPEAELPPRPPLATAVDRPDKDVAAFQSKRICAIVDHTADHLHEIKEIGKVDPALLVFGLGFARIILRRLSQVIKDLPDFDISFDESEPTP